MNSSNQNITFKGNPLKVQGEPIAVGNSLPAFKLTANDMSDIDQTTYAGKLLVISVVPSLDTPTCSMQTKRFNQELTKLSDDVVVLCVSMDLPFAQKRWCGAEGVENVVTASDYKYRSFSEAFSTYMPEMGLLARAVFIVDRDSKIAYVDYAPEMAEEPDYDSAISKLKELE